MTLYSLDGQAPEVSDLCYIADNATVIGKIRLKRAASVWFGAVLRGDNEWIEVGERSFSPVASTSRPGALKRPCSSPR